tara:strand:+ start:7008 stop:7277 length:270 start_codon:yes stop_codon:yes gene_type:complete
MLIYSAYKPPPEPPRELWLEIDLTKIRFETKKDLYYVKNVIIRYNPELYTTINTMYKIYEKNRKAYLEIIDKYDVSTEPKIIRKKKSIN